MLIPTSCWPHEDFHTPLACSCLPCRETPPKICAPCQSVTCTADLNILTAILTDLLLCRLRHYAMLKHHCLTMLACMSEITSVYYLGYCSENLGWGSLLKIRICLVNFGLWTTKKRDRHQGFSPKVDGKRSSFGSLWTRRSSFWHPLSMNGPKIARNF